MGDWVLNFLCVHVATTMDALVEKVDDILERLSDVDARLRHAEDFMAVTAVHHLCGDAAAKDLCDCFRAEDERGYNFSGASESNDDGLATVQKRRTVRVADRETGGVCEKGV